MPATIDASTEAISSIALEHSFNWFYTHNLPFELTGAQKRVMHEIRADMASGRQMNRLLQGDVALERRSLP